MEKAEKEKSAVKVKGRDPVTIEWLKDGSKFHKEGTKSVVHKLQAQKFVKAGKAKIVKKADE